MSQQLILDLLPPSPPTLDNFVVGDNAPVLDALHKLQPGRALYLWGSSGSGRSHLLRALGQADHACYLDASQACKRLPEIIAQDAISLQLIAIDEIEALQPVAQAALFALYNRWREAGATSRAFALLLAGDRAPVTMPLREDLRTRLGWDLVYRLEQLSDIDRAKALQTQALERGLQLGPEVINWVLTHYTRNMSHLSALLNALDHYSIAQHRAITLPLLKDLLASTSPDTDHTL